MEKAKALGVSWKQLYVYREQKNTRPCAAVYEGTVAQRKLERFHCTKELSISFGIIWVVLYL